MDENLRSEIRSLVQEEISSSSSPNPTSTNLPGRNIIARTRELIRQSVESATTTCSPSHSLRLSSSRGKRKADKEIKKTTLEVCLLRKTSAKEYTIMEESAIAKQVMVNILQTMDESQIRLAISNALKSKVLIDPRDISFAKRDRNKIILPCCPENFQWGYSEIKKLSGPGKLYVQAIGSVMILDDRDSDIENYKKNKPTEVNNEQFTDEQFTNSEDYKLYNEEDERSTSTQLPTSSQLLRSTQGLKEDNPCCSKSLVCVILNLFYMKKLILFTS